MKRILAPLIALGLLFLLAFFLQNVFPPLVNFLAWFYLTKETISAPITTGQAIVIDIATHFITYSFVGSLFGLFGSCDEKWMHVVYVIASEVVSLTLVVPLRFILDYYWILIIVLGVLLIGAITLYILTKKKEKKELAND